MGFLWDWNEIWPFPVMWSLLIFHFAGIECITFTASSFSIWNSSTGIPSPPLALFVMMLPKDNLTSHSRMSGCLALGEWSHHHDYLGHQDIFNIVLLCILATSSQYLLVPCHFCPFCAHFYMKFSLGISNFLEEISSLSHSIIFFLFFFALITEEVISPCYSLELCIQMFISLLFSFAFHFSSFHSYL